MATELERLVITLEARTKEYERALARAQQVTVTQLRKIEGSVNASTGAINKGFSGLSVAGIGLQRVLGGLIAGFSVQKVIGFADSFTRIENAIRLTGQEGEGLTSTMDALFASAQRHGAPIEALAQLYSRLGLVQKELGISSEELIVFSDNVAAALRVSGKSAAESSGALLQLSQALGSGVVRAEEFNSVLEGALPIAQAVARGLDAAGGSVARLRQLVVEGKVSSQEFFAAFQRGAVETQQQAQSMALTVGQAMTNLTNAAIEAIGKIDERLGATSSLAKSLAFIAESITIVANEITRAATPQERLNVLAQQYADKAAEINQLIKDRNALIERGFSLDSLPVAGLTEQLKAARTELDALAKGFSNLESQSPIQMEIEAKVLPTVTRGVGGAPDPEVAKVAAAIEEGFARELQQIEAIKLVLSEGNITAEQRTELMARLATLQGTQTQATQAQTQAVQGMAAAVSALPAQIYQPIVGAIGSQVSELRAIEQQLGLAAGTLDPINQASQRTANATEQTARAVEGLSTTNLGGPGAFGGSVGGTVSTTVSNAQAAAIGERQEALQAELAALQALEKPTRDQKQRIEEINTELAKLSEALIQSQRDFDLLIAMIRRMLAIDPSADISLFAQLMQPGGPLFDGLEHLADILLGLDSPAGFARGGRIGGKGSGTSDSNLIRVSKDEHLINAMEAGKHRRLLDAVNEGDLSRGSIGDRLLKMLAAEGFDLSALTGGGETQASHLPAGMQWAQSMGMRPSREPSSGASFGDINVVIQAYDRPVRGSERAIGYRVSREIAHHMRQAGVRV